MRYVPRCPQVSSTASPPPNPPTRLDVRVIANNETHHAWLVEYLLPCLTSVYTAEGGGDGAAAISSATPCELLMRLSSELSFLAPTYILISSRWSVDVAAVAGGGTPPAPPALPPALPPGWVTQQITITQGWTWMSMNGVGNDMSPQGIFGPVAVAGDLVKNQLEFTQASSE